MPIPAEYNSKIERPSIRDEVYKSLLDWITEGVLGPGEKIVDKEVAANLGVSRTPVREAIRRLEDKDLVESSANRWTRVTQISSKEPEMIYPIIWTLEQLAVTSAAGNIRITDLKKMEQANSRLKEAIERNDPVSAYRSDSELHDIIIERSLNPLLIKILQDLKIRYRRLEVNFFKGTSYDDSSVREHENLITSLRNKDIERAEQIIYSNWKKSLERHRTMIRQPMDESHDD